MSKLDTLKALSPLQLAYSRDFPEKRMEFYVEMLKDVQPKILASVVIAIIDTSKFLPTIAEIREKAWEAESIVSGDKVLDQDEAWGLVQRAIASVGVYGHPEFASKPLQETVNNLGWKDICKTPVEDTGILRAQFRRAYEMAVQRNHMKKVYGSVGIIAQPEKSSRLASKMKQLAGKMDMESI